MPNPGSPEAMRAAQEQAPMAMPKGMMFAMLFTLVVMFAVMGFRTQIGAALNCVFQYIDFNGQMPVLTLMLAGAIMITLSSVLRFFITDAVGPAMSQYKQRKFSQAYREARLENNLNKMKKYEAMQPKMMMASQQQSSSMMMAMPVTMVVIIPIYAWIYYFVSNDPGCAHIIPQELLTISLPWGYVGLNDTIIMGMPMWIFIYSLISLPLGQVESKILLYWKLSKRLKMLDQGITPPEWKPFWKRKDKKENNQL